MTENNAGCYGVPGCPEIFLVEQIKARGWTKENALTVINKGATPVEYISESTFSTMLSGRTQRDPRPVYWQRVARALAVDVDDLLNGYRAAKRFAKGMPTSSRLGNRLRIYLNGRRYSVPQGTRRRTQTAGKFPPAWAAQINEFCDRIYKQNETIVARLEYLERELGLEAGGGVKP